MLTLTQTVTYRDERGHLISTSIQAALGNSLQFAGTVHIEQISGALCDWLTALSCKTHVFARHDATGEVLVVLPPFDHHFYRPRQALRRPPASGIHCYERRSPAMALGVTDHLWSFQGVLRPRIPLTP
ncbi:MAG TPA: hypothetical protein VGF67_27720 [Ktedonobacteraceae bacterium]